MRLSYSAAALVCCTLLLAGHMRGALGQPIKTPTPRRSPCFTNMTNEIKRADAAAQGYGIIFYGDSITETLRGTDKCRSPCDTRRRSSCAGVPEAFQAAFRKYRPGVMGMSMDESAHLLWRIMNGQTPKKNFPKVAVILIGTNDMTNSGWSIRDKAGKEKALAREVPGIVSRIQTAAQLLRKGMPGTTVLILGELPRGTGTGKGLFNADNDFRWPSHYAAAVASINSRLKAHAAKDPRLAFLDCGGVFLTANKRAIDSRLMADAIHPTAAGWGRLIKCMSQTITALMAKEAKPLRRETAPIRRPSIAN